MRHLEESFLLLNCPGECSLGMSEELALDQVSGNGAAVHRDENLISAFAFPVNEARNQFFSGAGFTLDENRGLGSCHTAQKTQDVVHLNAAVDDLAGRNTLFDLLPEDDVFGLQSSVCDLEFCRQALVFAHQFHLFQRFAYRPAQFIRLPWLGNVFVDFARVDRCNEIVHFCESGQNNPDKVRIVLVRGFKKLDAGHVRHFLIGDDGVDRMDSKQLQRLLAGLSRMYPIFSDEGSLQLLQVGQFVIDHQQLIPLVHSATFS